MKIRELKENKGSQYQWKPHRADPTLYELRLVLEPVAARLPAARYNCVEKMVGIYTDEYPVVANHPIWTAPFNVDSMSRHNVQDAITVSIRYFGSLGTIDLTGFSSVANVLPKVRDYRLGNIQNHELNIRNLLALRFSKNLERVRIVADSNEIELHQAAAIINKSVKKGLSLLETQQELVDAGLHQYAEIKK